MGLLSNDFGSNDSYLLLEKVAYCTEITKPYEIIGNIYFFQSLCLFLSLVKSIRLEPYFNL